VTANLTDLEQHLLAYYASGQAKDLNIAGRFYPYGELVLILEDKVKIAARKFGLKVTSKSKGAGKGFLDYMIEKGAWSTKPNEFGGTMHQFQPDVYRTALAELNASNPIIQKAAAAGDGFWEEAFAAVA
jgi:hypothetical protein